MLICCCFPFLLICAIFIHHRSRRHFCLLPSSFTFSALYFFFFLQYFCWVRSITREEKEGEKKDTPSKMKKMEEEKQQFSGWPKTASFPSPLPLVYQRFFFSFVVFFPSVLPSCNCGLTKYTTKLFMSDFPSISTACLSSKKEELCESILRRFLYISDFLKRKKTLNRKSLKSFFCFFNNNCLLISVDFFMFV